MELSYAMNVFYLLYLPNCVLKIYEANLASFLNWTPILAPNRQYKCLVLVDEY